VCIYHTVYGGYQHFIGIGKRLLLDVTSSLCIYPFFIRKGSDLLIVSGCTFSLTAKEKVPKRKLAAGFWIKPKELTPAAMSRLTIIKARTL
jgi:hypothetical protein